MRPRWQQRDAPFHVAPPRSEYQGSVGVLGPKRSTYELGPRVVNGPLFVDLSGLESVSTRDDGTYMSSSFATSSVCQNAGSDDDANGQSLCPHTSLNNLPESTNNISAFQGEGSFTYLLRRRLKPVLHNDRSSQTHTGSPTSNNQRILVLKCPIANFLVCRKRRPSPPFCILLFVKQFLSGAFPESIW